MDVSDKKRKRDPESLSDDAENDNDEDPLIEEETSSATSESSSTSEGERDEEKKMEDTEAEGRGAKGKGSSRRWWRLGVDTIGDGEELQFDPSAYEMYHQATFEWSCLSFDILPDDLGLERKAYPHTMYITAGTQAGGTEGACASNADADRVYISKWSNLTPLRKRGPHRDSDDADDDDSSDDSESEDSSLTRGEEENQSRLQSKKRNPVIHSQSFKHPGEVLRIRHCPLAPRLLATWSSDRSIYMWDVKDLQDNIENESKTLPPLLQHKEPRFTWKGHPSGGWSLAFNPYKVGVFVSGGNDGAVCFWTPVEAGWKVGEGVKVHEGSVEDLQWKKDGKGDVVASASTDRSIILIDTRAKGAGTKPSLTIAKAHDSDVNAIDWSSLQQDFILSGGDDGCCRIWDTRHPKEPLVHLAFHKEPITSVEWHPTDAATLAIASLDDSISMWDMSVEPEDNVDESGAPVDKTIVDEMPEQLMFQHMGQRHIQEIHWHPRIPGVIISTAEDGFNVFKTFNI